MERGPLFGPRESDHMGYVMLFNGRLQRTMNLRSEFDTDVKNHFLSAGPSEGTSTLRVQQNTANLETVERAA